MNPPPPKVLFLGIEYAGHKTRFMNLRENTSADPRIRPTYRRVSGWREDGRIEQMGLVPRGIRGRLRATLEAAQIARLPRPDVIWTSADDVLAPYFWSQLGPLRRPMVMDLDSSPEQLEENAPLFLGRPPHKGARRAFADMRRAAVWPGVSRFAVTSRWAAGGLGRMGVAPDRIRILPPGVDLERWRPAPHTRNRKLRLLFVGADFERKGGPALLDVVRSRTDDFELDLVTRADLPHSDWYRVHRADPNSPLLQRLYAEADLFVLPTRAECFGVAAVEALASGLPVVMGDVGAAREIVDEGETGFVIRPDADDLACVLDSIARDPGRLDSMRMRARSVAEQRFDGRRNDGRMVDLLLEEHELFVRRRESRPDRVSEPARPAR